jgi:hypothetical protein
MVNRVFLKWNEIFLKKSYSVSSGIKRMSKPNFLLVRSMTQTSIYMVNKKKVAEENVNRRRGGGGNKKSTLKLATWMVRPLIMNLLLPYTHSINHAIRNVTYRH